MSVLNSEVIDGMAVDINENALRLLIQKNTVVNIQENYKNEQVQLFAYSVNNSTRFQAHLKRHGVKIEKQFGLRGLIRGLYFLLSYKNKRIYISEKEILYF